MLYFQAEEDEPTDDKELAVYELLCNYFEEHEEEIIDAFEMFNNNVKYLLFTLMDDLAHIIVSDHRVTP